MTASRRRAGLLIPLFSIPSSTSWGIGDIGDLACITRWLAGASQSVLQLLPINEMASGQQSPYSALSAMAIDPIYIRLPDVEEFAAAGGEAALPAEDRALIAHLRESPRIAYADVRRVKDAALRSAFARFTEIEVAGDTPRAQAFRAFTHEQAWWLSDYALYRALHRRERDRAWMDWPAPLRNRDAGALDAARRELADDIGFRQYTQWLAGTQWARARERAAASGVALFGDLPFMVDGDSADVWARQEQFRLDASVGVPPDAFSATGQDWGMPVYRWDALANTDYAWLRDRARRSAQLFDGYRIDHLVGFYRTYGRPHDGGEPFFTPADEDEQRELGERLLGIFRGAGADIVAEDLGTVPDFVRESLARLAVPGYRVFRWERQWHEAGQPFRDPVDYPAASVAASGTHDTETVAVWWDTARDEERDAVNAIPTVQRIAGGTPLHASFNAHVRDTLLEALFASGSDLLLCAVADVFGWQERINGPGTVSDENWTFRLPWFCDALDEVPDARERQAALRRWSIQYSRSSEGLV